MAQININQTFPYTEQSLVVEFSTPVSAELVKEYLAVNSISATLSDDGKQLLWVIPDATGSTSKVITANVWTGLVESLELTAPMGTVFTAVTYTAPAQEVIPTKWMIQKVTNEKFFPITHQSAVIDDDGNKLTSVVEYLKDRTEQTLTEQNRIAYKVLQTEIAYGMANCTTESYCVIPAGEDIPEGATLLEPGDTLPDGTTVPADANTDAEGSETADTYITYSASEDIVEMAGDSIVIQATDYAKAIIDEDGNILVPFTKEGFEYILPDDTTYHIATLDDQTGVVYSQQVLSIRRKASAAGSVAYTVNAGATQATFNDDGLKSITVPSVTAMNEAIADANTDNAVTVAAEATPTTGYAKTYNVKQGGVSVGLIDIPDGSIQGVKVNGTAVVPDTDGIIGLSIIEADDVIGADELDDVVARIPIVDAALSATSTNAIQNKAVKEALDTKVDKVTGKGLSTNDFTDTLKTKLDGIEDGAEKNIINGIEVNGVAATPSASGIVSIACVGCTAVSDTADYSDIF